MQSNVEHLWFSVADLLVSLVSEEDPGWRSLTVTLSSRSGRHLVSGGEIQTLETTSARSASRALSSGPLAGP